MDRELVLKQGKENLSAALLVGEQEHSSKEN